MRATQIAIDGVSERKRLDIIRTVIFSDGISRAQIAQKCGVSSMTVGKVISALLSEGIVACERSALRKGKNTELFRASENINILVFCFEPQRLSVSVSDTRGNILFSHSEQLNASIPYDTNITDLITSVYENITHTLREKLCAVAVITSDGVRAEDLSVISSILPDFYIDISADRREYIAYHMRENYPEQSVLLVHVGEVLKLSLYCRETEVRSRHTTNIPCEQVSATWIAEILAELSHIIIPDTVMLEYDREFATGDILQPLKSEFCRRSHISESDMPKFILTNKSPISVRSAIKRAADCLIFSLVGASK